MTLTPEMIDAMVAAGVTREQMAEIIKADILADRAAAETRLAAKREATAARVRRHREGKRNAGNALQPLQRVTGVTAPTAPLDGPPLPPAPPSPPLNPPTTPEPQIPAGSAPPSPPRRYDWPEDFEGQFWAAYPRHTDRKKAMAALAKVHRQDRTPFADILAGCARLRASSADAAFLPHATTWLNGERWDDELPDTPRPTARASPPASRSSPGSRLLDRMETRRARSPDHDRRHDHDRQPDLGPVLDHEGDGEPHRQVHEPAGGQARRFSPEAALRIVGAGRR